MWNSKYCCSLVDEQSSSFIQCTLHYIIVILTTDQDPRGGLIDKPGKSRDYYHTCYTLSGLSIAQYIHNQENKILGPSTNLLVATHPVYNVGVSAVMDIKEYFQNVPVPLISDT